MTTTMKPAAPRAKRQFDPDVARLRQVKEAARKLEAASVARDRALKREKEAQKAFEEVIAGAPPQPAGVSQVCCSTAGEAVG